MVINKCIKAEDIWKKMIDQYHSTETYKYACGGNNIRTILTEIRKIKMI